MHTTGSIHTISTTNVSSIRNVGNTLSVTNTNTGTPMYVYYSGEDLKTKIDKLEKELNDLKKHMKTLQKEKFNIKYI